MKKPYHICDFEVGISFIPFLIVILLFGYYKLFFTYFLITLIHELGHALTALIFKIRVNKIKLSIFGFSCEIDKIEHLSFYKQFLIFINGPLTYFISLYLIKQLYLYDIISLLTFYKALDTNKYILFFNLLPIYPLDGGRILKLILDKIFTFKVSRGLLYFISLIFMFLFVIYTIDCKQYLMYVFLITNFIINILTMDKEWKMFLLNRYYFKNKYKDKLHKHNDLFIYKNNYILKDKEILNEKEAIIKLLRN